MASVLKQTPNGTVLVIDGDRSVTIGKDGALSVDVDSIVKSAEVRDKVGRLRQHIDSLKNPAKSR